MFENDMFIGIVVIVEIVFLCWNQETYCIKCNYCPTLTKFTREIVLLNANKSLYQQINTKTSHQIIHITHQAIYNTMNNMENNNTSKDKYKY